MRTDEPATKGRLQATLPRPRSMSYEPQTHTTDTTPGYEGNVAISGWPAPSVHPPRGQEGGRAEGTNPGRRRPYPGADRPAQQTPPHRGKLRGPQSRARRLGAERTGMLAAALRANTAPSSSRLVSWCSEPD